jgi:hypothetical protein
MTTTGPRTFALIPCTNQCFVYCVPIKGKEVLSGISKGDRSGVAPPAQHLCIVQTVSPVKSFMMDFNFITMPASYHSFPFECSTFNIPLIVVFTNEIDFVV